MRMGIAIASLGLNFLAIVILIKLSNIEQANDLKIFNLESELRRKVDYRV